MEKLSGEAANGKNPPFQVGTDNELSHYSDSSRPPPASEDG